MCGISALVSKSVDLSSGQLVSMNDALKHRGPDGYGVYVSENKKIGCAHRRLSLVDLSSYGAQPMTKHNRTIVFNGEIYNFREINRELKEKGYVFSSQSDTETILSSFEEWGIDCIKKFNGAFAFVLHDHDTDEVYVVRDRIGEKPLYYTETSEYFIFASEVKAFMSVPGVTLVPNADTIKANLIFHFWADKEQSYFHNIFSLRPGNYMKIRHGTVATYAYWDVRLEESGTYAYQNEEANVAEYMRSIYGLLEDATRIRLAADCEVGSLLSGGIDSSLITFIAARISLRPLKCFTLSMKNHANEDLKCATLLAKSMHTIDHRKVDVNDNVFSLENFDRVTRHLEEAVLNKISLYVNTNYRTVQSTGLKAVLNGQGSDEITLGYYYYYDFLHRKKETFQFNTFSKLWHEQFFLKDYMPRREIRRLVDDNLTKNYLPYLGKDTLNSVLAFGVKTHLLNILNHEDRLSMAEGVECRTVFTDYRLIEMFMSMPSKYKVLDGREKYVVRKLAERLLPKGITTREKMGFPNLPDGSARLVHTIISSKGFRESTLLNEIFDRSLFSRIEKLPFSQQWKLASIYRFEKVFFG